MYKDMFLQRTSGAFECIRNLVPSFGFTFKGFSGWDTPFGMTLIIVLDDVKTTFVTRNTEPRGRKPVISSDGRDFRRWTRDSDKNGL